MRFLVLFLLAFPIFPHSLKDEIDQPLQDLQSVARMIAPEIPIVKTSYGIIQFGSPPETAKVWSLLQNSSRSLFVGFHDLCNFI